MGPVTIGPCNPMESTISMAALPNTALARALFGDERILFQDDNFIVCTGSYYIRYLQLPSKTRGKSERKIYQLSSHPEMTLGALALNVNSLNQPVIASIYVDDTFRRQGIATKLVERAFMDFPTLCLDGRFSIFGAAFFGARNRAH